MWKLRKTSTKWKKTAKNAIFVLVDKGLPKQFRDRASYLSTPRGRNVTPGAAVLQFVSEFFRLQSFALWTTLACREWSAELCTICPYLFFHFSGKTWHLEPITVRYLKRDIWYVNSHGQFWGILWIWCRLSKAVGWSLHSESNVGFKSLHIVRRRHLEVFTTLQSLTTKTVSGNSSS